MRLKCPLCGERDRREFYYKGAADYLARPDEDAGAEAWDAYLHQRENKAGRVRELWQHEAGCGAWLVAERDTVSHEVFCVQLAVEAEGGE